MSLTPAELVWLANRIGALPGGWSLETIETPCDRYAILLPAEGDRFAASFLIDRVPAGYRVSACRWDGMQPAGLFQSLAECLAPVMEAAQAGAKAAPFPNLQ